MQTIRNIFAFALAAACAESTIGPPADAGLTSSEKTCTSVLDCPVGEACEGGVCVPYVARDAGAGCTSDADCASGEVCAPSTGVCVDVEANDAGTPATGQTCRAGETRQCGLTKVGACDWGVLACANGAWPPDEPAHCDGAVYPATEACNGEDDDCNNYVDDGAFDSDGDGFTTCGTQNDACCAFLSAIGSACASPGVGVESRCVDCDDRDAARHPGQAEACNGTDDDCDGVVPEAEADADSDRVRVCAGDCDDRNASRFRGAPEACNGVDDDCDGTVPADEIDDDGDGARVCSGDCDDADPLRRAGAGERCNGLDDDCDGSVPAGERDDDADGVRACAGDCNDRLADVRPGANEPCGGTVDLNCDGRVVACACRDGDGDGYVDAADTRPGCAGNDCDDANAQVHPGAGETCNGRDDDCSGHVDDGSGDDRDADGFTACGTQNEACCERLSALGASCATPGRGTDARCADCADTDAQRAPGADERCNGLDDDCDGAVPADEGDADRDGSRVCAGDCDDARAAVNPGATETCNGLDDDCDGAVDENAASDRDADGFSACGTRTDACCRHLASAGAACASVGLGTDARCLDCNDEDGAIRPGAGERCNGLDDDCDGATPEGERDTDGDGYRLCSGDCDDTRRTVNPGASETCNALDDDCSGADDDVPGGCNPPCADADSDGFTACGTRTAACCAFVGGACTVGNTIDPRCLDCADNDGSIHPRASEGCNGKDDDCDSQIDETFDRDADGFTTCGSRTSACCAKSSCAAGPGLEPRCADCNDSDSLANAGVVCDCARGCTLSSRGSPDGADQNCNGYVDESCSCSTADSDRDGLTQCAGDCNDADRTIRPGATELCDGKDNDCNKATTENCGVSDPCNFAAGTDQCRPNLLCARDVRTGRYACGSFCNYSQRGLGVEDGCQAGESCNTFLLNTLNLHLCSVTGAGTLGVGASCGRDSDCKSSSCLGSGAARYCTDLCGSSAYCGNGTTCQVLTYPGSATSPPAITGQCLRSTLTNRTGASCARNTDCASGFCDTAKGRCGEVCCQASDCPSGYHCADAGPSVNQAPYGVGYVGVCLANTSGNGGRRAGAACSRNSDCLSEFCERTNVGTSSAGICVDFCCHDANCANGTTCEFLPIRRANGGTYSGRVCVHMPVKGTPLTEQSQ